ncbi:unnamed protein product [Moneuplotes crassus]|uniref:Uncharacterized protein n=1 Tax=Euplotes crassus TaxID=5936 RepID=A0AAD1XZZ4_EUPCR|nr:unnamed protein product [Moneuplotes crassus]
MSEDNSDEQDSFVTDKESIETSNSQDIGPRAPRKTMLVDPDFEFPVFEKEKKPEDKKNSKLENATKPLLSQLAYEAQIKENYLALLQQKLDEIEQVRDGIEADVQMAEDIDNTPAPNEIRTKYEDILYENEKYNYVYGRTLEETRMRKARRERIKEAIQDVDAKFQRINDIKYQSIKERDRAENMLERGRAKLDKMKTMHKNQLDKKYNEKKNLIIQLKQDEEKMKKVEKVKVKKMEKKLNEGVMATKAILVQFHLESAQKFKEESLKKKKEGEEHMKYLKSNDLEKLNKKVAEKHRLENQMIHYTNELAFLMSKKLKLNKKLEEVKKNHEKKEMLHHLRAQELENMQKKAKIWKRKLDDAKWEVRETKDHLKNLLIKVFLNTKNHDVVLGNTGLSKEMIEDGNKIELIYEKKPKSHKAKKSLLAQTQNFDNNCQNLLHLLVKHLVFIQNFTKARRYQQKKTRSKGLRSLDDIKHSKEPLLKQPASTKVEYCVVRQTVREKNMVASIHAEREIYIDEVFGQDQNWELSKHKNLIQVNQFLDSYKKKIKKAELENLTSAIDFLSKSEKVSQRLRIGIPHKKAFLKIKGEQKKEVAQEETTVTNFYNRLKAIQEYSPKKEKKERNKPVQSKSKSSFNYISSQNIDSMPSLNRPYRLPSTIGKKKDPQLFNKMPANWKERRPSLSSMNSGNTNQILEAIEELSKTGSNRHSVSSITSQMSHRRRTNSNRKIIFHKKECNNILASGSRKISEREKRVRFGKQKMSIDTLSTVFGPRDPIGHRRRFKNSKMGSSGSVVFNEVVQNNIQQKAQEMAKKRRKTVVLNPKMLSKSKSSAVISNIQKIDL